MYVRVSRQNIKTAIVNIFHMFEKVEENMNMVKTKIEDISKT